MTNPGYPAQPPPSFDPANPPLWAPDYNASFLVAIKRFFQKYAVFNGRASRSEFWWVFLALTIVQALFQSQNASAYNDLLSDPGAGMPSTGGLAALGSLIGLAVLVPQLAIMWRRLHDTNRSGGWFFLGFTGIGIIVVIIFLALPSKPEGARYDVPTP
ncbi:MAG: DUF805 domain-containing protein [Bifidobacteriaceae bacterium]|jgi:uncharacterized membrane protein YhaH (DUF805 family)|nr:DUF805 domain-containing protein [Bifidobacteriaceae bacterium]